MEDISKRMNPEHVPIADIAFTEQQKADREREEREAIQREEKASSRSGELSARTNRGLIVQTSGDGFACCPAQENRQIQETL